LFSPACENRLVVNVIAIMQLIKQHNSFFISSYYWFSGTDLKFDFYNETAAG
jgi:hypothetical protein